jgi:hypothetical protein
MIRSVDAGEPWTGDCVVCGYFAPSFVGRMDMSATLKCSPSYSCLGTWMLRLPASPDISTGTSAHETV